MTTAALATRVAPTLPWRDGLAYGGLGLPLAFVALPLYVLLPNHYATEYGVPLAWLGAVLLGARLFDALVDPLIGRWADTLLDRAWLRAWQVLALAALALAIGFWLLFFPAVETLGALLGWCALALLLSYLGFSVIGVIHQAWGARLGGDETQRARIVAWREGLALLGVLIASIVPALAGLGVTTALFAILLLAGVWLLQRAPRPARASRRRTRASALHGMALPWATPAFRRLLAIFLCNGIASAVPATLVLFFVRDRLEAPAWTPLFLAGYFAAAALSVPAWVRLVGRLGLARSWLAAMLLAIASFGWAWQLQAGDVAAFLLVCLASGLALGADLSLPAAMLTGVVQRAGHAQRFEGAYLGWWNFAGKLNLALAAGAVLPALQAFGYEPGARDAAALAALSAAYGLLPIALKLGAAGLLYFGWIRGAGHLRG